MWCREDVLGENWGVYCGGDCLGEDWGVYCGRDCLGGKELGCVLWWDIAWVRIWSVYCGGQLPE